MTEQEWLVCEHPARMLDWVTDRWLTPTSLTEPNRYPLAIPSDRRLTLFANAAGCPECVAARQPHWCGRTYAEYVAGAGCRTSREKAAVLRDILGNPFRPVKVRDSFPSRWPGHEYVTEPHWLTREVLGLARTAEDASGPDLLLDPFRLGVLADAAEDAGCDLGPLLAHLRLGPPDAHSPKCGTAYRGCAPDCPKAMWEREGQHVAGCWALDLILGKE